MNPSIIREILKVTEQPGIVSLAGGLPSADTFPVEAMREACDARAAPTTPARGLQYAASEGFAPLREWVAAHLAAQGMDGRRRPGADHHRLAAGPGPGRQGADRRRQPRAVETPTYLGALQAFAPYEPDFVAWPCDDEGPLPEALAAAAARRALRLPAAQLPEPERALHREARRAALVAAAQRRGLPLVEDNPYGDLWFDAPPPPPLAARWPEGVHLPRLVLQGAGAGPAPGLRGRAAGAVPQAAAGQAGGRPAHARASTSASCTR